MIYDNNDLKNKKANEIWIKFCDSRIKHPETKLKTMLHSMFCVFYEKYDNKDNMAKMITFFGERSNFITKYNDQYLKKFRKLMDSKTINIIDCKDMFKLYKGTVGDRKLFIKELVNQVTSLVHSQEQIVKLNQT
jgi:hypothetical protein